MRTTDIPKHGTVIEALATTILVEEQRAQQLIGTGRSKETRSGPFVGMVKLQQDASTVTIPIHENDRWFWEDNPLDNQRLPLAAIVRTTDDQPYIYINPLCRATYVEAEYQRDLIEGIIAHEVGHFVAGHLQQDKDPLFKGSIELLIHRLLAGDTLLQEKEIEANLYAVRLLGLAPILAMLALYGDEATKLSTRMLFSNYRRVVMARIKTAGGLPETTWQLESLTLLSDTELVAITQSPD
jgi:hypothetical protein